MPVVCEFVLQLHPLCSQMRSNHTTVTSKSNLVTISNQFRQRSDKKRKSKVNSQKKSLISSCSLRRVWMMISRSLILSLTENMKMKKMIKQWRHRSKSKSKFWGSLQWKKKNWRIRRRLRDNSSCQQGLINCKISISLSLWLWRSWSTWLMPLYTTHSSPETRLRTQWVWTKASHGQEMIKESSWSIRTSRKASKSSGK